MKTFKQILNLCKPCLTQCAHSVSLSAWLGSAAAVLNNFVLRHTFIKKPLTFYNKETLTLYDGWEISVDYNSPIGKEFIPITYKSEAALESHYPATLKTIVFVRGVKPISPNDKSPLPPSPEI